MNNNCYNCKYCQDEYRNPFAKTCNYCTYQQAWIYHLDEICPVFKISFISRLFGDRTPKLKNSDSKLYGGCIKYKDNK